MASFTHTFTPTVGTAAYIAGDSVGGNIVIPLGLPSGSGGKVIIDTIHISDKSKTHPALFFDFFKSVPVTVADSSPIVYGSGDFATSVGIVSFLAADWVDMPRVTATCSKITGSDFGTITAPSGQDLHLLIHSDSGFSLTAGDLVITVSGRNV